MGRDQSFLKNGLSSSWFSIAVRSCPGEGNLREKNGLALGYSLIHYGGEAMATGALEAGHNVTTA